MTGAHQLSGVFASRLDPTLSVTCDNEIISQRGGAKCVRLGYSLPTPSEEDHVAIVTPYRGYDGGVARRGAVAAVLVLHAPAFAPLIQLVPFTAALAAALWLGRAERHVAKEEVLDAVSAA